MEEFAFNDMRDMMGVVGSAKYALYKKKYESGGDTEDKQIEILDFLKFGSAHGNERFFTDRNKVKYNADPKYYHLAVMESFDGTPDAERFTDIFNNSEVKTVSKCFYYFMADMCMRPVANNIMDNAFWSNKRPKIDLQNLKPATEILKDRLNIIFETIKANGTAEEMARFKADVARYKSAAESTYQILADNIKHKRTEEEKATAKRVSPNETFNFSI